MKRDVFENLEPNEIYEAIAEGVDRAITRAILSGTDMPSADFFDTIGVAAKEAFYEAAFFSDKLFDKHG